MFTALLIRMAYYFKDMLRRKKRNQFQKESQAFVHEETVPDAMPVTVSVIVPVYNGGAEFKFLLEMLKVQEGIATLEVIIVDSGSADGSLELAERYGAKVVPIIQADFSHSYARNLGVRYATCEFLLFMTQDACPTDAHWLRSLLISLLVGKLDAVSCYEMPRADCDLFGRVTIWEDWGIQRGRLSNHACLLRKSLFDKYLFRFEIAEDFDLGMRLREDGYKIAMLSNVRIIHSHTRSPYYYFKRAIAASLVMVKIQPKKKRIRFPEKYLLDCILTGYSVVKLYVQALFKHCEKEETPGDWAVFCKWTKKELDKDLWKIKQMKNRERTELLFSTQADFDSHFQTIIQEIYELAGRNFRVKVFIFEKIRHYLCNTLSQYFDDRIEERDNFRKEEIGRLSEKLIACFSGDYLGVYAAALKGTIDVISELAEKYSKGI